MERSIHQHLTRKGYKLEYSLVGSGEPVLILHGGHSNCHEELGYAHLVAHGFRVITPSAQVTATRRQNWASRS
ncbi:hypothetical protein VQ056_33385 [Paenibacillus sp. JTLBN-2024]